jgi:hypothetical protein
MTSPVLHAGQIQRAVESALASQPVLDMHTHLYPPAFGTPVSNATGKADPTGLMLWGIDELLTYHYLVAEVLRVVPASAPPYESFWKMTKTQQADHIWKNLFIDRTPVSEACRGVVTTLTKLGLDPTDKDLSRLRKWFAQQDPGKYIDRVMELSNVASITMTNPVFDDNERDRWLRDGDAIRADGRFRAVLRIDPLLRNWPQAAGKMTEWGFACSERLDESAVRSARRFLEHWIDLQGAIYLAVSLPPEFRYPSGAPGDAVIEDVIRPVCSERKLPFAMMIGSRLRVNPALRDAGDMVGKSDVSSVVNLCRDFPGVKFFATMLSREDQHELAVAARKFDNLMVFGCWWFLNNPSLVDEITRMRVELLGTSFIPQHSDARVLDQLIYKWAHSRALIGRVLAEKYEDLSRAGWPVVDDDIRADVKRLLADNFTEFLAR